MGAALGLALAGVVSAQPGPPMVVPPSETPTVPGPGPDSPTDPGRQEAPPAAIAPPPPSALPSVDEREATPAPPPKARVAEKPVEAPIRRARYDFAVLQALDKVTAETVRFEAAVGRPVRWKGLIFTVRACERSAPDEPIEDAIVYLTVDAQPRPQPGRPTPSPRQVFRGWMYASSPGLNPLQHATYDAWAISCRASAPLIPATAPPPAARPVAEPAKAAEPPVLALPPARAAVEASPAPKPAAPPASDSTAPTTP